MYPLIAAPSDLETEDYTVVCVFTLSVPLLLYTASQMMIRIGVGL
jgi:hypothetical protein